MTSQPRQTRRAWAGAGIIVALVLIAGLIFLLDDLVSRLRPTYTVHAVLQQAPGITRGSEVWVSGRAAGSVLQVGLLPGRPEEGARVGVLIELPDAVREQVRRDSRVRITSERLVGEPVLDIAAGSATARPLAPGDTLYPRPRLDAAVVTARARSFRLALDSALAELRAVQAPLDRRLQALERVQFQLARAQYEYDRFMHDVRASPALGLLQDGEGGIPLAQSRAVLGELHDAVAAFETRARSSGAVANTRSLVSTAGTLRRTLAALDSTMRVRGGTVDRLARDSALVLAIAGARAALDSLIADAKRRPFRYVF